MTFDEQVEQMLACLPRRYRIAFLAGIRFHQGHAEHGESLFQKTPAELATDEREEHADAFTYRHRRRWLRRHNRE